MWATKRKGEKKNADAEKFYTEIVRPLDTIERRIINYLPKIRCK